MPIVDESERLDATLTASKPVVADPARKIVYEVGDSKQAEFYPQFKTLHWDNEANFSARLVADDYSGAVVRVTPESIEWEQGEQKARFYELPPDEKNGDGGFEIEVEFASRPSSNVVAYSIQTKELEFLYQGELTEQEIKEGHYRPENVVGSYAVYHASKANNISGGKEYRTGKAFHIYRPEAVDADGVRVWCELAIDAGLLTVTVPQKFLDTATYPVIVDPTFGYTSAGGSSVNAAIGRANIKAAYCLTATSGDTITSFSSYYSSTASDPVAMAAYSMSAGLPASRLAAEQATTGVGTLGWHNTATVSQALTGGVDYCVAVRVYDTAFQYYDIGSGNERSGDDTAPLPATWTHNGYSAARFSIYATYTAGGGGTTVAGTVGTATASGIAGSVDANRTVAGSVGVATASGIAGGVDANRTIAGVVGVATAEGLQGTVSNTNDTVVTGSVGTATASGVAGTVAWNRTLAGIVGEAVASGITGGVQSGDAITQLLGIGGWGPIRRRKPKDDDKPQELPEVVDPVAPKPRKTLKLADIIGQRAQISSVDISGAVAASKKRKRQQEDELLLLM